MDDGSVLWEWAQKAVLGLLGLLLWYFKRTQDRIEKRLDDHDEDIEKRAMINEVDRHRIETDQRFRLIEGDVKNLGQQFANTLQTQLTELRRDVFSAIGEQNKRLDQQNQHLHQLLLAITKRNNQG